MYLEEMKRDTSDFGECSINFIGGFSMEFLVIKVIDGVSRKVSKLDCRGSFLCAFDSHGKYFKLQAQGTKGLTLFGNNMKQHGNKYALQFKPRPLLTLINQSSLAATVHGVTKAMSCRCDDV